MSDDHLPIRRMSDGGTPAASAAVAPPIRSECAPYLSGSRPAAAIPVVLKTLPSVFISNAKATVRVFCFTHHVAASRRRRDFRRERERRTPRIPPRSVRAIESGHCTTLPMRSRPMETRRRRRRRRRRARRIPDLRKRARCIAEPLFGSVCRRRHWISSECLRLQRC